jgi:hypothetical protein
MELGFKYKTGRRIMSRIVIIILIYHHHKPIDLIHNFILVLNGNRAKNPIPSKEVERVKIVDISPV